MAYPDPEIQSNPEFYSPWPLLGKRLNFQWGNIRQDIGVLKAIARAQVQDVETGDDFINADRVLTGLEFGELVSNTTSFKNRFRLFYDKVLDKFCIQYNDNTEASPNWIDYLCIDQGSGLVTVTGIDVGELGIDVSGGFYGTNGYTHFQGSPAVEWVVNHNLDTAHLVVQTYNTRDRVIQFDEADTSNPNIAYFYFVTPQNGKAVLFGHGFVDRAMHVSESDGTPPTFNTSNIIFDSQFFYLGSDSSGDPIVSLRGAALGGEVNTASSLGGGEPVFAQKVAVDLQFKSLTAGSNVVLTPSSTEIEIAAIADKFYGITVKHSNDTESFSGINVVTFNSNDFYISQNSPNTDEVIVNFRGTAGAGSGLQNVVEDLTPELGGNLDVNGFAVVSSGFDDININSANGLGITASTTLVVQTTSGALQLTSGAGINLSANNDIVLDSVTGNIDADSNRIVNVGAPVLGTDAARLQDVTAQVGPGFYGLNVRESDGNPPSFRNDTIIFDSTYFYLHSNSVGKPTVSLRGSPPGSNINVRESDGTPPYFATDTITFDSSYFYLHSTSVGKPSVSLREDNILVSHVNDFDLHKHVSGFYAIRDDTDGFITRINWKNGDFNIVNRNASNVITSIVGRHYRKTFTRDDNGNIVEVNYVGI